VGNLSFGGYLKASAVYFELVLVQYNYAVN